MIPLWITGFVLMVILNAAAHAANNSTLVTWDVTQPTCEMDGPTTVTLGDSDGNVDVSQIFYPATTATWLHAGEKSFELTVNQCNGALPSGTNLIPDILVEGTPFDAQGDNLNQWEQLFKTGGDSSGVYIVLYKSDQTMGSDTGNKHIANNTYLYIPTTPGAKTYFKSGEYLAPSTDYKIPLMAAVACGRQVATGCRNPNARAGYLYASFTFTFAYR